MTLSLDVLVGTYVVRAKTDAAAIVPALRKAVTEADRGSSVTNVLTVEQYAAGQLQDLRHYAILLSVFGGISVLLSAVGLFGMMAQAVSQRTNEIGIRVALGATSRVVLALVTKQGMILIITGMAIGLLVSVGLTRVISRFLWGVSATDPLTFAVVLI